MASCSFKGGPVVHRANASREFNLSEMNGGAQEDDESDRLKLAHQTTLNDIEDRLLV
jgi:hypothetical protein